MKAVIKRLTRLEDRFGPPPDFVRNPRYRLRLVVSRAGPLSLERSKCTRTLASSGALIEVVRFDGYREGLSDSELARFVDTFPVERI
jgi:hypothetical protein